MARRTPPRKVSYFEPVPPRLARNTIIESTFDVGRRFRCTMRVDCGQLDPAYPIWFRPLFETSAIWITSSPGCGIPQPLRASGHVLRLRRLAYDTRIPFTTGRPGPVLPSPAFRAVATGPRPARTPPA
jgi:hypothetical protein